MGIRLGNPIKNTARNFGRVRDLAVKYGSMLDNFTEKEPSGYMGGVGGDRQIIAELDRLRRKPGGKSTFRFDPKVQLDLSQVEDRRGQLGVPTGPPIRTAPMVDPYMMALHFSNMREARNQRSTGTGVKNNGKQRRRN